MNPKKAVLIVFLLTAVAGLGLSAYTAMSNVKVSVAGEKINISPSTATIKLTAGGYATKNFTIKSSSTSGINVKVKVIPADSNTVKAWGDEFVAVVSPDKVKVSSGHPAKVTLIAHSEKSGNYRVKLIAVK